MRWPTLSSQSPRLIAVAILGGMAGWCATGSLQQDFAAYYTAGAAAGRGLDPYLNHVPAAGGPWDGVAVYRHSRFLYPPLAAELMRPLAAMPFSWAKALFTAASVLALLAAASALSHEGGAGTGSGSRWEVFALLGAVAWPPVFICLERGQIDLLLLAVLAAAWRCRRRPLLAGALLGGVVLFKPQALGVLPLLVVARRYRWAAALAGAALALVVMNVVVCGTAPCAKYLREVLPRAAQFGEGGPEALLLDERELGAAGDDMAEGVARLNGQGRGWPQELASFRRNASLVRLAAGDGRASLWVGVLAYFAIAAALAIAARRAPERPAWYWAALVAGVVTAPVAWAMGLVWALPLVHPGMAGASAVEPAPAASTAGAAAARGAMVLAWVAAFLGPFLPGAWVLAGLAAVACAIAPAAVAPGDRALWSERREMRAP